MPVVSVSSTKSLCIDSRYLAVLIASSRACGGGGMSFERGLSIDSGSRPADSSSLQKSTRAVNQATTTTTKINTDTHIGGLAAPCTQNATTTAMGNPRSTRHPSPSRPSRARNVSLSFFVWRDRTQTRHVQRLSRFLPLSLIHQQQATSLKEQKAPVCSPPYQETHQKQPDRPSLNRRRHRFRLVAAGRTGGVLHAKLY